MAINQNTMDSMTDWYTKATSNTGTNPLNTPRENTGDQFGNTSYGASATSSTAQKASSASPYSTTPTGSQSGGGSKSPGYDVAAWYRSAAGREADKEGLAYWQSQLESGADQGSVYREFVRGLIANNDLAKPGSGYQLGPATIDKNQLTTRGVTSNQTVAGQLQGLLDANSKYIQSARDRSLRAANARGLTNSSIAAGAGEEAAFQAALPIATSDAQAYRDVDAYNAALYNQGLLYNADAQNQFTGRQQQIEADRGSQSATLANQLRIAQLQADVSKYQADKSNASSQYNTDANIKNQAEQNKTTLVNNIIQSTELSPDRKAALLRQLGEGRLADAIYVGGNYSDDLRFGPT